MPVPSALDLGSGPGIVLLHGVGTGPQTFAHVARNLADDHRVVVLERPWDPDCPPTLAGQARGVAADLEALGLARSLVVGVSGGATLALVLAIEHPDSIGGIVVHEPLVGAHAPALQERFSAAARLAADGDEATVGIVRSVVGERTWSRAPESLRASIRATASRSRAEIPEFASFDPSLADLARLRGLPLLTTVGALSGADRHEAASVIVGLAGGDVAQVPGSGNAAQLDAPDAFAGIVRRWSRTAMRWGG